MLSGLRRLSRSVEDTVRAFLTKGPGGQHPRKSEAVVRGSEQRVASPSTCASASREEGHETRPKPEVGVDWHPERRRYERLPTFLSVAAGRSKSFSRRKNDVRTATPRKA